MIRRAEERGEIKPGDTLIEATSGNTGIALAMAAAIRGYRMVLIMPEDLSVERAQTMKAFGAELILTPRSGGMEYARDLAEQMQRDGKGRVLDQFANADNPRVHYETTGPEIWARHRRPHHALRQRDGHHRHHHRRVALPEGKEPGGAHHRRAAEPKARASRASASGRRPTCRRSTTRARSTSWCCVSQADAEEMARRLAREEGLFAGISAAGACWVALQMAAQVRERDHRVRRLRPRRPLPVHRRVPGLTAHAPRPIASARTAPRRCSRSRSWKTAAPKTRLRCPACGWTHWNNPTPVLAAVIEWPTATASCCWRATPPGRAACSR